MGDSPTQAGNISEELGRFLRRQILAGGVSFDENTPLRDLGVDSFALVELLLFIEKRFGAAVPESHLTRANLHSVAALARCVQSLTGGEAPAATQTDEP